MPRWPRALAAVLALACVGLTAGWFVTQWHPGGYDEITHLQNARNVFAQLSQPDGLWDALQGRYPTEERPDYWPGLAYVATAPFLALAPDAPAAPLALLIAVAAAWAAAVVRGARRLAPDAGALALWLALLGGLPLITLRHYTPMAWEAALSMVATALLVRSDGFRRPGASLAWGLVVAAGLMSDRLTMATLIWLTPLAALLSRGQWVRRCAGVLLALAPILLLAGPFYERWLRGWGQSLVFGGRADNPWRLGELALWIPLHGLEPLGALAVGAGLVLAVRHHADADHVWWAAAAAPLPLLSRTDPGQEGLVVYVVGPLAVLAAAGWARSGQLSLPRTRNVAVVLTLWAVLGHAGRGGVGPRTPQVADPGIPRALSLDAELLRWADIPGEHAVLDLRQAKEGYAGHWVYTLFDARRPDVVVDWPVRRVQTEYDPDNRFVADPCAFDHVLVIHQERPWAQPTELRRPLGLMGLDEDEKAAWFAAVAAVEGCTRVAKTLDGPGEARFTWLASTGGAPIDPGLPTTADAQNPAELDGWDTWRTPEGRCPEGTVQIPRAAYTLGRDPDGPEIYALAPTTVTLGPFCIDVFEYPNLVDRKPRTNVSWFEAKTLCEQAGKRLCRSLEWEAACRGTAGRRHSYGDSFTPGRCYTEGARHYDDRDLRPIGGFPDCGTPEGVRDLDGGVSEWVLEDHAGPPFPPDGGDATRPTHVIRGGTMWTAKYGQDCLSRHWHAQGHRQEDDGFRCCSDPIP